MYGINDVVVYKNGEVCKIVDIRTLDFLESSEQYYIMQPLDDIKGKIYIKVHNDSLIIRPIISETEAEKYLEELPNMQVLYNTDDKVREFEFRRIIKVCECEQCLRMLKGIINERNYKVEAGKKLNKKDEENLYHVGKLLAIEFSVALNIPIEQARHRIEESLFLNKV